MRNLCWVFVSVLFGLITASAQNIVGDVKYRLAESYERSGDFESAVKLYEEVFRKDSSNMIVFDALRRDYLQLKRYDDAVALMQHILRLSPNDIGILAQLGSVYILKSDEPKASEIWERAIAIDPKKEPTYRMVAAAIVQSRLFDRAIGVYQRGRTAIGDPNLFAFDIAYLYSITLNYAEATREYLKMIRQNPGQLSYVQSRIAGYTARTEGLSSATAVAEDAIKTEPNNIPLHQLVAWLSMEGKRFERAYAVYKYIDEKTNARGHELYNFAERALHEQAYPSATKAYQDIITTYPNFDLAPQTKFGYAQALERSDTENDTLKLFGNLNPFPVHPESESHPLFTGAIAAYERVIKEFPTTEVAARSLLRIAILKQEKFFDLDGARASLESVIKTYRQYPQAVTEATIRLGDVFIAIGDLNAAAAQFQSVAGAGPVVTEAMEISLLRLAEIDYFREQFKEALTKLKSSTTNAVSDATNDALSLQIFIQENLTSAVAALKEFAKADLLHRQHKLAEALDRFETIIKNYPKTDIVDETLINIGDIYTQMSRYADAIATYERLITDYPESISLDRTTMKIAKVYELGLKNAPQAIDSYQRFLEKFPNSIYVSEARKRVRALRGDTL